mgnify:CR=1 FL=1
MTLTVDDLRRHLGIGSYTGNEGNTELERALTAASKAVERYCIRTFAAPPDTASTRIYDQSNLVPVSGRWRMYVDDFVDDPDTITESCDRVTWTTVTDDWFSSPDNAETRYVLEGRYWDRHVKVTAKWGVGPELLAEVELPTLMKAAQLFKRRDSVNGVEGFGEFGVVRITKSADPHIAELLDPLVRTDRMGIA